MTTDHYFLQQLSPLPKLFQRMSEDFVVHRETANVLVLIYQICSLLIQVKSLRNIYLLHIRLPRRRKKRFLTNTHTHQTVHSLLLEEEWWWDTVISPSYRKRESQFYWSAICATNRFATHLRCLTDSQLPGTLWQHVATDSMCHFNCSEKCTTTASPVSVPKAKEWMYFCSHVLFVIRMVRLLEAF